MSSNKLVRFNTGHRDVWGTPERVTSRARWVFVSFIGLRLRFEFWTARGEK